MKIAPRICKMCGEQFTPNSCHQVYCKRNHYRICPICGKTYLETNVEKFKNPPTACSKECKIKRIQKTSIEKYGITAPGNNPEAREKAKKTMIEKYGVEYAQESNEIKQKSIDTYIRKFGVDNPQKCEEIKKKTQTTNLNRYGSITYLTSKEGKKIIDDIMISKYGTTIPLRNEYIKEKCISTNLERYGTENPGSNEQVREKMKHTSIIRYGTEYPQSSEIVKQHIKDTFIRNYGVDNYFKAREIIEKIHKSFFEKYGAHSVMEVPEIAERIRKTNMQRYGVPYYIMKPDVAKSSGRISKINRSISDKLIDNGIDNKLEFTLGNNSYDILIPQGDILIEVDPSYTHNVIGNHWNTKGISWDYHLKKSIYAEQNGYRCIHLWDWDCVSKFISSLTCKNIIYDKVSIEIIEDKKAIEFIRKYSLYDITENAINVIYVGAVYKSKIICLIGFQLKDVLSKSWNIVCIEHRFNYNVYKGNQKILDFFIEKFNPINITAYADYSKSNGEILENLGFKYNRFLLPNKIWSKGRHAIIDDNTIIKEAMILDNWLPVYNCGYKVYQKEYIRKP